MSLKPRCQELRLRATPAEQVLWELLRKHRLGGLKFRRQHQFGACILDFFCPEKRLAVEVDGSQHQTERGEDFDEARTNYLGLFGVQVLRFTNAEVLRDSRAVARQILEACLAQETRC